MCSFITVIFYGLLLLFNIHKYLDIIVVEIDEKYRSILYLSI